MEGFLRSSKRLVEGIHAADPMPAITLAQDVVDELNEPTDISVLAETLCKQDPGFNRRNHALIVWTEACVRNPNGISESDGSSDATNRLLTWLARSIEPPQIFGWRSIYAPDPQDEVSPLEAQQYRLLAVAGLRAIATLLKREHKLPEELSNLLTATLAAFTDPSDPWTHPVAYDLSPGILSRMQPSSSTVFAILQTTVRPAFSKQKQPALTAAGRAVMSKPDIEAPLFETPEAEEKPWKFHNPWIVTVFVWCSAQLEHATLNDYWPQVTPPTLALMDDGAVPFKAKGCCALQHILQHADAAMLKRTGLGYVFEQALLPMLALLPSLTEETESLVILDAAFRTLRLLAEVRFNIERENDARLKSLDLIMRAGVIRGYAFASDYPRVATLLARELSTLFDAMDIDAVKHLKTVVPLLVKNLCNPFATAAPALMHATALALQNVIIACSPRINVYAGEILKGIVIAWCRIAEEVTPDEFVDVRAALKEALNLLSAVPASDGKASRDVKTVLESDDRLRDLREPSDAYLGA